MINSFILFFRMKSDYCLDMTSAKQICPSDFAPMSFVSTNDRMSVCRFFVSENSRPFFFSLHQP